MNHQASRYSGRWSGFLADGTKFIFIVIISKLNILWCYFDIIQDMSPCNCNAACNWHMLHAKLGVRISLDFIFILNAPFNTYSLCKKCSEVPGPISFPNRRTESCAYSKFHRYGARHPSFSVPFLCQTVYASYCLHFRLIHEKEN
jgi:hypothetical protein